MPKYYNSIQEKERAEGTAKYSAGPKTTYMPLAEAPLFCWFQEHTIIDVDNNEEHLIDRVFKHHLKLLEMRVPSLIISYDRNGFLYNSSKPSQAYLNYLRSYDIPQVWEGKNRMMSREVCIATADEFEQYCGFKATDPTSTLPRELQITLIGLPSMKIGTIWGLLAANVTYVALPGVPAVRQDITDYELKLSLELDKLARKIKSGEPFNKEATIKSLERSARQLNVTGKFRDAIAEFDEGWEDV